MFGRGSSEQKLEYHDYYKFRIAYITDKKFELIIIFITGLNDKFEYVKKELTKCKKDFLNLFGDILGQKCDLKTFEVFDPNIDANHRNLKPKISLCGFSGVGKTTTTRLIKAEEIPMQHVPTITGDIATIKIGKLQFSLWDFAGQEQFSYLWTNFIKGSDAVLLITDSTIENVEKSKFFLELIKEQSPNAHTAVIGNKQDLSNAMPPETIEKILGLKTYSMIANREENRQKMITIIADVLEMSADVSPLLKPLKERDDLTEEVKIALENGDFQEAVHLFEKISDLCIDLGDDVLSKEFFNKAEKIKQMLKKSSIELPKVSEPPKSPETPPIAPPPESPETPPIAPPPKSPERPSITSPSKSPERPSITPPPKPPESPSIIEKQETIKEIKEERVEQTGISEEGIEKLTALPVKPKMRPPPAPPQMSNGAQSKTKITIEPEEFIIKEKPKQVMQVPKDAKNKLKTSAYGQVSNPTVQQSKPIELIEQTKPFMKHPPILEKEKPYLTEPPNKPLSPETSIQKPSDLTKLPHKPEENIGLEQDQKKNLQMTLTDLKIKRANISKLSLDFEMKELTGEISKEEYDNKIQKLKILEEKILSEIAELEKML